MADLPKDKETDWDELAATFAATVDAGPGVPTGTALLARMHAVLPFERAERILDIGCGAGGAVHLLIKNHGAALPASVEIIAGDTSTGMLAQVEKLKEFRLRDGEGGRWANVRTLQCDVLDMKELGDASVSHLTAGFLLFLVPDAPHAMAEIRRVLKPDGVFGVSSFKGSEWVQIIAQAQIVKPGTLIPGLGDWSKVEGVTAYLKEAGFEGIEVWEEQTWWEYEDPEAAMRLVTGIPLAQNVVHGWSAEDVEKWRQLGLQFLREKNGDGKGRMMGTTFLGVVRKGA